MYARARAVRTARKEPTGRLAASAHPLLVLQRQAGNAVVTGLVMQRFGRQVDPAHEPGLWAHVIAYRMARPRAWILGNHNVAVAINGAGGFIATRHSNGAGHAEVNLDADPAVAGNRPGVARIHTEREPCGGPAAGCEALIRANYITPGIFTANEVTWWGDYQQKRDEGRETVKTAALWGAEDVVVKGMAGTVTASGRAVTGPNRMDL